MITREQFEALCLACDAAYVAEWANGVRLTDRRSYRVKKTDYREFAMWVDQGPQAGIHLRVGLKVSAKDPRFAPSKVVKGKHNWRHVVADLEPAALKELIDESYTLSQQRGAGAQAEDALYRPLQKAVDAAGFRPQGLHAGGPPAKIVGQEGRAAFRLALWSVGVIAPLVDVAEQQVFGEYHAQLTQAAELLERIHREFSEKEVRIGKGNELLSQRASALYQARPKEPQSPQLKALCATCGVFTCLPGGYPTGASLVDCVENTVRTLLATGQPEVVERYLREFDARLLVEELLAVLKDRDKLSEVPRVERVLWRGADEKGFPALWLAQVDAERYVFFGKLGRKWTLVQGPRDDVLAAVPDTFFEAAAKVVAAPRG